MKRDYTPRKQAAHMTRLLKRREGEKKHPAAGYRLTMRMWMSMCREGEPIRAPIIQPFIRGEA